MYEIYKTERTRKQKKQRTLDNSDIKKMESLAKTFIETAFESGLKISEIDEIYIRIKKQYNLEKRELEKQIIEENEMEKKFRTKVENTLNKMDCLIEDSELLEYFETYSGSMKWYKGIRTHFKEDEESPERLNLPKYEIIIEENSYYESPVSISRTFVLEILCMAFKLFINEQKINVVNLFNGAKTRIKYNLYEIVPLTCINSKLIAVMIQKVIIPYIDKYKDNEELNEFLERIEYVKNEYPFIVMIWLIQNI